MQEGGPHPHRQEVVGGGVAVLVELVARARVRHLRVPYHVRADQARQRYRLRRAPRPPPVSKSVSQSVGGQSVGRSVSQSVSRSVSRSVSQGPTGSLRRTRPGPLTPLPGSRSARSPDAPEPPDLDRSGGVRWTQAAPSRSRSSARSTRSCGPSISSRRVHPCALESPGARGPPAAELLLARASPQPDCLRRADPNGRASHEGRVFPRPSRPLRYTYPLSDSPQLRMATCFQKVRLSAFSQEIFCEERTCKTCRARSRRPHTSDASRPARNACARVCSGSPRKLHTRARRPW